MTATLDSSTDRLQRILESLLSRQPIKQAVMAVESIDGSFSWSDARGAAREDGTPSTPETPFFLASIDKLLNATIVMKLGEGGQLDLDDPISKYLPDLTCNGLHRLDGVEYTERITVRHLLGHTSGLADWLEDRPKGGRSLVEEVVEQGDRSLEIDDIVAVVRDQLRPHFAPQDLSLARPRIRYSDTNYMLLIAIIEAVTGEPLHETHQRLFFRPLAMRHTFFPGLSEPLDPTLGAAVLREGGRRLHIPLFIRSIRGIYSTTVDSMAFLRGFIRCELFRDESTLASMQQPWNRFGFPLDRAALRAPSWPVEYGLGLMRFQLPRIFTPPRSIPAVLGHTGSTGCWLFYCPKLDVLLAGSVDEVTAGAVPYRVVPKVLRALGATR